MLVRVEAARSSAGWSVCRVDAVPTTYDKFGRAARLLGGESGDAGQVAWWAATMARISAPYNTAARPAGDGQRLVFGKVPPRAG